MLGQVPRQSHRASVPAPAVARRRFRCPPFSGILCALHPRPIQPEAQKGPSEGSRTSFSDPPPGRTVNPAGSGGACSLSDRLLRVCEANPFGIRVVRIGLERGVQKGGYDTGLRMIVPTESCRSGACLFGRDTGLQYPGLRAKPALKSWSATSALLTRGPSRSKSWPYLGTPDGAG
jgi:hypothetical protein